MSKRNGAQLELSKKGSMMHYKRLATLPLALNVFQGEYGTDYGKLAAGCVIALIPVVVIFAFIQKHLSGGATSGAVKG